MTMACTVLGAGSWGTALAIQLARQGHPVQLWDRNPERCEFMNREHRNPRYLKEISLPENLVAVPDLQDAVYRAELLVPVVPSHALRGVMEGAKAAVRSDTLVCCATKGIEQGSLSTMHAVLLDLLPPALHLGVTVLSGPSFALELAKGLPTTVVVAGEEVPAHAASEAFHGGMFRVYHTEDVTGVCIGGSLKNVMAIGCGISDGLGMGLNARAGLITRGLAEITRLAVAQGADPRTMMGLAGLGDLVLTCTGNLSRNRRVGLGLGAGRALEEILEELGEVAEGVITAGTAHELAASCHVEMPVTEQVFRVIHQGIPAREALSNLLGRERRHERD